MPRGINSRHISPKEAFFPPTSPTSAMVMSRNQRIKRVLAIHPLPSFYRHTSVINAGGEMESVQERYRYATPLKQGKSMGRLLFLGKCAHGFAPLGNREMHCGL